jgi:hypothetical protein
MKISLPGRGHTQTVYAISAFSVSDCVFSALKSVLHAYMDMLLAACVMCVMCVMAVRAHTNTTPIAMRNSRWHRHLPIPQRMYFCKCIRTPAYWS